MAEFAFRCVCGEPGHPPVLEEQPWARLAGYSDLATQWHASQASASLGPGLPVALLEQPPTAGEPYYLKVGQPFAARIGETFHCLYEPPLIALNGIYEGIDADIHAITLVRCRLVDGALLNDRQGVATVAVEAVTTVRDLLDGPVTDMPLPAGFWDCLLLRDRGVEREGPFVCMTSSLEGDEGGWAVFHDGPAGIDLLLYASWGHHHDHVWAGRLRMPPDTRLDQD
ncbi:MAG: hypothetical protein J0H01_00540 [Rhizobiales bacterium]|nr:hypothetical protein [Hyphomicrobiales bacterium]